MAHNITGSDHLEPVFCSVPSAQRALGNASRTKLYDWMAVSGDREPLIESVLLDGRRLIVVASIRSLPARLKAREAERGGGSAREARGGGPGRPSKTATSGDRERGP